MLAPEKQQRPKAGGGGVLTIKDRADVDRRAACWRQHGRIEEYLPTLYARVEELQLELAETREHIAREEQALKDLHFEATCNPHVVRANYKKRGRELPPELR